MRIAAIRASADESTAANAGAHHVVQAGPDLIQQVRALAPDGVDHIVEVAFGANIDADLERLAVRGSVATYATDRTLPTIPFWPLLFKNVRVDFLGSDDFARADKEEAARASTRHSSRDGTACRSQSGFHWTRSLSPTSDSRRRARADGSSCCFRDIALRSRGGRQRPALRRTGLFCGAPSWRSSEFGRR